MRRPSSSGSRRRRPREISALSVSIVTTPKYASAAMLTLNYGQAREKTNKKLTQRRRELMCRRGLLCGRFGRRLPAQDGLAGGLHFVEAGEARGVRRAQDEVGIFLALARDVSHGVNEEVELLFRLALGRLDHERAGNDERERHGIRMESVINEALGDVAGLQPLRRLLAIAEHDL